MLLEKDHFFPKQQKAWVSKSHCERLPEGEQKVWKWAQMSFYRTWKQEMLLDMALLSHDLDQLDELEQVQVLAYPAIPAGHRAPATAFGMASHGLAHAPELIALQYHGLH